MAQMMMMPPPPPRERRPHDPSLGPPPPPPIGAMRPWPTAPPPKTSSGFLPSQPLERRLPPPRTWRRAFRDMIGISGFPLRLWTYAGGPSSPRASHAMLIHGSHRSALGLCRSKEGRSIGHATPSTRRRAARLLPRLERSTRFAPTARCRLVRGRYPSPDATCQLGLPGLPSRGPGARRATAAGQLRLGRFDAGKGDADQEQGQGEVQACPRTGHAAGRDGRGDAARATGPGGSVNLNRSFLPLRCIFGASQSGLQSSLSHRVRSESVTVWERTHALWPSRAGEEGSGCRSGRGSVEGANSRIDGSSRGQRPTRLRRARRRRRGRPPRSLVREAGGTICSTLPPRLQLRPR